MGLEPGTSRSSARRANLCTIKSRLHPENNLNKHADDTYLIIPSINSLTVAQELDHVSEWAAENNLKLNSSKSVEVLGVIVTDTLSFEMLISGVISKCAQTSYALRIMCAHGLNGQALWDETRSTLVSKLMYASPVWLGFLNEESKKRCWAVLNRMKRACYLGEDFKSFAELREEADVELFKAVTLPDHVMYQLLPPLKNTPYHLRPRAHNFELPYVNSNLKKNFIHRMLYSNSY